MEIDIHPADAKHLSTLRERLESRLETASGSANTQAIEEVLKCFEGTKHSALVPLAWQIIMKNPAHRRMAGIWFVAHYSEDLHAADMRLARLLSEFSLPEREDLFRCWAQRETPISPDAFYLLANSECLWDRLLAYIYLNKLCDQRWANKFLADLSKITQPLPPPEFAQFLRDLDDESFRVREAASAKLEQFGERVEPQLHQALHTPLSPEARRRVRFILERIATAKKSPEWKPILAHLESGIFDREATLSILRALVQGRPDAELTKAAVANLNKVSPPKRGDRDGRR